MREAGSVAEEQINIDAELLDSLSPSIRVLTIKAVNWTPWWGGDYLGNTITVKDGRIERISLPSVETVKGVTKWVLRAALSCHFRGAGYKKLNELIAPIYGGAIKDANKVMHFDSMIIFDVKAEVINKQQLDSDVSSLLQVVKKLWDINKQKDLKRKRNQVLEALQCLALSKYTCAKNFFNLQVDCKKEAVNALKAINVNVPPIIKVFGIPRLVLTLLNVDSPEKIFNFLPLPPNTIKIEINLSISRRLIRILGNNVAKELIYLTGLAIIYALEVVGLGRGSSRGFGRFKITNVTPDNELSKDLIKKLEEHAINIVESKSVKESIKALHRELLEKSKIITQVLQKMNIPVNKLLGKTNITDTANMAEHNTMYRVPCIDNTRIEVISSAKHPFPAPIARLGAKNPKQLPNPKPIVSDVYESLSAIGYATTKAIWKAYTT